METDEIGIVILAAGGSARFGKPKQLLQFQGASLLRRAVDTALLSDGVKVVVVLGEGSQVLMNEIDGLPVTIAVNDDWRSGISSSIKIGLKKLLDAESGLAAAIIMLCDQPLVNADMISALIDGFRSSRKPIVASRYQGTLGVPALFAREMFEELLDLKGDVGAKPIINRHASNVCEIDAPEATPDIDRPEDYERLLTQKQQ
ncbi:MAG: nucleotidyltransferase family protein [Acidobacteriota bacterium]